MGGGGDKPCTLSLMSLNTPRFQYFAANFLCLSCSTYFEAAILRKLRRQNVNKSIFFEVGTKYDACGQLQWCNFVQQNEGSLKNELKILGVNSSNKVRLESRSRPLG